ncbi:MAG: hypothetical protein ACQESE_04330 [Nanobdellota archaeon]
MAENNKNAPKQHTAQNQSQGAGKVGTTRSFKERMTGLFEPIRNAYTYNNSKVRNWAIASVAGAGAIVGGWFICDNIVDKNETITDYQTNVIPQKDSTISVLRNTVGSQNTLIQSYENDIFHFNALADTQSTYIDSLKGWGVFPESKVDDMNTKDSTINAMRDKSNYKSDLAESIIDSSYNIDTSKTVTSIEDENFNKLNDLIDKGADLGDGLDRIAQEHEKKQEQARKEKAVQKADDKEEIIYRGEGAFDAYKNEHKDIFKETYGRDLNAKEMNYLMDHTESGKVYTATQLRGLLEHRDTTIATTYNKN